MPGPKQFNQSVSATATSQAINFGFNLVHLVIINDGDNEVFLNLESTTATTSDVKLEVGESLTWNFAEPSRRRPSGIGLICSTGETATVRVSGWR